MLHVLHTVARFERVTSVPADAIMNNWHWQWDDAEPPYNTLPELEEEIFQRLNTFYTSIDSVLSDLLDANSNRLLTYDLADPEPRVPRIVTEDAINLDGLVGTPLPAEIAVVLSFRAINPAGTDARRYRNRVYLGPIGTTAATEVTGDMRVTDVARAAIGDAAQTLLDANDAGLTWVVYSPTDGVVRGIDNGFVDNAFDIQRRRGSEATLRTTFGLP